MRTGGQQKSIQQYFKQSSKPTNPFLLGGNPPPAKGSASCWLKKCRELHLK